MEQSNSIIRSMESKHKQLVILRCKLVIVGDSCVGKTAITQVFQSGGSTYPKNYLMTVGAEFCVKQVPIPNTNTIIELYIFDCAGQSIFNQLEMNTKYYENASAVMVVYDISKPDTLKSCAKWISGVRGTRPSGPQILGLMVGNKCEFREDITDSRAEVNKDDAKKLATELGVLYYEVSAANNINIEEPFKRIAEEFYNRYEETTSRSEENFTF